MRRGRLRYRQGRYAEAVGFAHAAIELARQVGDARTLAHALEHADLGALELGCPAGEGARRALAIYEEVGALFDAARVRNTLGVLAYHQGAWSEALDHYAAAAEAHHRSGREWDAAIAVANRAEILADQGHLREAGEHFERAIAVWRGCHAESAIAFGEYQLGRLAARLGDGPQARALLHRARDYFAGAGETSEVLIVEALIAESEVLAGAHAAALSHAEATLHRARTRARGTVPAVLPLLARVRGAALLALDRREEADAALREGLEAARRRGARHHVVFILRALLEAELWRDEAEAAVWREECARLAAALGLVAADSDRQLAPR
jgi:tetratricopeptide (TPR) repeat protein